MVGLVLVFLVRFIFVGNCNVLGTAIFWATFLLGRPNYLGLHSQEELEVILGM